MSTTSGRKNMFSNEDDSTYESDGDLSVYSDADFDDVTSDGDRYDDELLLTNGQKIEDELEDAELNAPKLEDPDEMNYILPTRVLPSVEEQYEWLYSLLDADQTAAVRKWAVGVIEKLWVKHLTLKKVRAEQKHQERRVQELRDWKSARYGRKGILCLGPLIPFETEYAHMSEMKQKHNLIKVGIEERIRMIKVRSDSVIAAEKAAIRFRKAGKARALANRGMNKNTAWHTARRANSLAFKTNRVDALTRVINTSSSGHGKRAQRKIRQEKDRKAAIEYAARLGPVEKSEIQFIDLDEEEKTEEERALEKSELDTALALINRQCVALAEKRETEEKEEMEEKKRIEEEKEEEDQFVTMMVRNQKPKSKKTKIDLGFKGLMEQTFERRRESDKKYSKRCEGFEDLADKEKLQEKLKFTALCKSVTLGKKCYHKQCRFAHKIEDLVEKECRFGQSCRFVKQLHNGQYENIQFGRTGKSCCCMHPGEHKRGFCKRIGLKYTESVVPVTASPVTASPVTASPVTASPVVSVWAKVVTKAETAEKMTEYKEKMTKPWREVVVAALTDEEKKDMYGRGATILGTVSVERDNTPVIPTTIRKSWDKRGLGFAEQEQKTSTKLLVTAPGFSWVKGTVLQPPPHEKKQKCGVNDPIMEKVMAAVLAINKRIAGIDSTRDCDITERVKKAKEKAVEINSRLEKQEQRRKERANRKSSWKKVGRCNKNKAISDAKVLEKIVIRVPREDGELALLSALRNGLQNFRIEYSEDRPSCSRYVECL